MSSWLTALVTLASVLLGGGGLAVLVNAVTGRRGRRAEVADRLSDSSLKWVQEFQEEATSARMEAAESRRETADARREVAEMRREVADGNRAAEELGARLHKLIASIHDPAMTLDRLRVMVPLGYPPSANGVSP